MAKWPDTIVAHPEKIFEWKQRSRNPAPLSLMSWCIFMVSGCQCLLPRLLVPSKASCMTNAEEEKIKITWKQNFRPVYPIHNRIFLWKTKMSYQGKYHDIGMHVKL